MGAKKTGRCLTSNCTKLTAHESGICHLHRKRRVNANGEIEWCFPANCYFKTDNERAKANFCLLPKARKKQKPEPIKSFAELDKLLKTVPKQEQRTYNNNPQRVVQLPEVELPVQELNEVIFSDAVNKNQTGLWKRVVQIFLSGAR